MNFEEIRRRNGVGVGAGSSTQGNTNTPLARRTSTLASTSNTSGEVGKILGKDDKEPSFGDIRNQYVTGEYNPNVSNVSGTKSVTVDSAYINSYFTDFNSFIQAAQNDYKNKMGWGTATGLYDTYTPQWEDLRTRSGYITSYLENNKAHLDPTQYEELYNLVGESRSAGNSIVDGFEQNKDFYSKFGSQREYDTWWKRRGRESEFRALLSTDGFESWAERGRRDAENPTWEAAHAPLDILGWQPFGDGADIGNMVTFAEANKDRAKEDAAQALRTGGLPGQHTEAINLINNYMTEEEKGIYNYYIGRGEKDKADDYLNFMMDIFREREGGKIAALVDNTPLELVFSIGAGLQKPFNAFGNIDNFLMGTEADPTTSLQYASGEMSKNNEGIWKVTNDLLNTTANMLPSILVGTVTGGLGGAITMGISAGGNAYAEMRNLGYDAGQARAYAVLTGASEAVLSRMLDGISALGGGGQGIFQNLANKVIPKFDNALARVAIRLGGKMFDEGLEEIIQEALDPIFMAGATGENFEGIDIDAVLYSGLLGALSAGLIEGPGTTIDGKNAKDIYGGDVQALVTEALEIDPQNPLALKAQAKLDAGKELSGFTLSELVKSNDGAIKNEYAKAAVEEALKQNPNNAYALRLQKKLDAGKSITEEQLNKLAKTTKTEEGKKNAEKYAKTEELLESDALEKGLENAGTIAGAAVNGVKNAFDDAVSGAEGAVKDAVSGVVNNVSSSVEGMLGLAENTFDEVTKNLWGGISDLWGGLSGIGQNAQRAVENGVNAAKDAVGGAIDGAKDAAGNAVSATVDKVKSAVESELSALGEAGERASEIADVIAKKLRGIDLSEAEQKLFDTSDAAKQAFANLGGEISEGANDAASKVGETVTSIKDKVKDTLDSLGEVRDVPKLTDIITKKLQGIELTDLEQKIFDVSEHGKEALESLKGKVEDAVGGVKSTVEGVIDKATGAKDNSVAENATKTETSTESEISASETATETESSTEATTDTEVTVEQEGVATDTKVESIDSITESGVNLKLQNDTIVNSNDVSFKNTDIGLIYQAVTDMTTRVGGFNIDTANTFVKGYTPDLGISAGEYIHGWSDAYRFGAKGFPASELVTGTFTSRLPAKLRNTAYNFGKAFGNDAIAKSITPSITKPTVSYQTITRRQGSVVLPKGVSVETLTPMQRDSIKGLEVVSQALGKKIILFDDGNSNSNGSYNPNNGDIRINIRAGLDGRGVMLFTGSHELTHDLRVRNPQGFKKYADAVLDSYVKHFGKDGLTIEGLIRDKLDFLERNDALEGLSEEEAYDLAYEEVIADSAESMLTDSKAFEEFSKRIQKEDKSLWDKIKKFFSDLVKKIKAAYEGYEPDSFEGKLLREMGEDAERLQKIWVDAILETADMEEASSEGSVKHSYSSIAYTFFGDKEISIGDLENGSYKETEGYKKYVDMCLNNMRQTSEGRFDKEAALAEIEDSIDGIVRVAVAMKKAGYDILDNHAKRSAVDSKNRLLFSSLEPNSDYFTSSDISTICDKRINFSEIYDEIVRREEAMGVPADKRFFANIDNYFIIHDIMADKGLTQPCRECYVESMRKNLAPMANAFLELMQETVPDNKANKQLYQPSGKNKGELKSNNAKLRENLLKKIEDEKYDITVNNLTVEMLTTPRGLATLKLQAPFIYETFNSFYGQSKPKMPKEATPFRFGELTALLKDDNGKIRTGLIKQIMSTGGFRLQSYSDFQIQNFADVLQVIFEAGTLGLNGHAYTKVPAFLDATKGTNLKRNISIFMYNDGGEWKIDRNDSFPYALEEIYDIVKSDEQGNTSIIAVSQNEMMSSWIMANDNIGYFIPFHKSGMKMGTVRETVVKEGGREIKGYSGIKDHTRQQTEVWAKTTADHKALTKVNKGINIYDFWDFDNADNLSREGLIEKNVRRYIDACEKAGYLPKFREYVMNNSKVLNAVLDYSKQLGFVSQNATIDDISFKHKGYRIPYGYYKCLGDFGMFTPDGKASPIERLSLKEYNFDEAVAFFSKAKTVKRNEILQQIANGEERERYRNSNMTTAEIAEEVQAKRNQVVDEVVSGEYKKNLEKVGVPIKNSDRNPDSYSNRSLLAGALEGVAQNDIERDKLQQYKEKIDLLNAEEQKLLELRAKIKELSFAKGTRDTEAIKKLQLEATKAANRVNIYDKQLLNLESTKALKGVLEREKALARKKAMQRGKETLQRYRERGIENSHKSAMRYKIKDVIKDLNRLLKSGNKDRNVKEEIKETVSSSLALAEVIFSDSIRNEDIVRLGVDSVTEKESKFLNEYSDLLDTLDALNDKIKIFYGTEKVSDELLAKIGSVEDQIKKVRNRISYLSGQLSDVFERERARLNKATANAIIANLASEYKKLELSDSAYIRAAYDEYIYTRLDTLKDSIGGTPVRDMSLAQLTEVYDAYKMVEHFVRNANKAFKAERGEAISTIANRVLEELDKLAKKLKFTKAGKVLSKLDWNNFKPIYAFERIGSSTFGKLFKNIRDGEDVWAKDMTDAKSYLDEQKRKYKFNSFNFDKKYKFTSSTGLKFELNLGQIMSLYAYSKRGDQAKEHLEYGGFVFDGATEVKEKNKAGITVTYELNDSTAYKLDEALLGEITKIVTDNPNVKGFVDAMQKYLSTTMGEKGNEVSMELYGVRLFKEENYFPLKTSQQYLERAREQATQTGKIKNKGFTKETQPHAHTQIVLASFMDVWADHVTEMSMYHSFTLPMEDFYRVYNYSTPNANNLDTDGVIPFIEKAHGKAATEYVDQLLKDLNGGARSDSRETPFKALMTNFKKASVIASASVVVQQPSAIIRAQALVDAKYFVGISGKKHSDTWTEIKKYAPVAIIKEMGYFDVGMGQSSVEWLKGEKTLKDKMDDALSKAPALADEYTWGAIWNAVKRETARKNPKLKTSSEEFLKLCGERFTEVIVKTQVYDSTLARSANMRSKSAFMNMLTAFMAEPTTSINMLADAFKKGNKKQIARTMGAVYGSVILNSALVSLVYAMRDDDEDETFLEKYLSRLTTEVIDGINPLTYLPFVKDIWSAAQGFDVERADMTLITKTLDSLQQLIKVAGRDRSDMSAEELREHNKAINEAILSITDNLASLTGLPVKNIRRDINAVINGFKTIKADMEGRETTAGSLADNILEDVKDSLPVVGWLPGDSKGDKLYRAIVSGDKAYAERLKSGYSSDSAYNSAIRKALRENDPRIKEAAEARYNGDIAEYMRIAKSIIAEGHFKQDDVVAAINSEINAMKPDDGGTTSSDKAVSLYKIEDYYAALDESSFAADTVKEDMIAVEVVNGKDRDEAETSFYSKFVSHIRDMYDKGEINDYKAKDMLVRYGDKTDAEAASKVQYWSFKKEYPDYDLSESAVSKYYSDVKPSGISIDVYYDYSKQRSKAEGVDLNGDGKTDSGSVKREVLQIINSLPISRYQKNVLYYLNGWSQSTMSEAPWY